MPDSLNIGIVGLGVMGHRMLERLRSHPRLRATMVWDANPDTCARALQLYPELRSADSVETLIATPGLHGLYIATPPGPHMRLSALAFDAGLAVLCEKPLTTDFDAARRLVRRMADDKLRGAVNFSLASSHGLACLQHNFGAGSSLPMGPLQNVRIDLAFAAWPRPWQMAAGAWLSERAEGGFSREVLSHFIFVLQRVLGPAAVWSSKPVYPPDGLAAETALEAELRVDEVPVHIKARVDANLPVAERNRMVWRAQWGALTLRDWFGVTGQRKGGSEESLGEPDVLRERGQADQLEQWVAMIEGREHLLPGFDEALAVQQTIESMLQTV